MFEAIPPKEPEDIFAEVEKPTAPPGQATRPTLTPAALAPAKVSFFSGIRKILLIILISLVGLGIVGGGGWLLYNRLTAQPLAQAPTNIAVVNRAPSAPTNVNVAAGVANQNVATNVNVPPSLVLDSKGLTAEEEKKYGLDPTKDDTDGDGLSDREEIKVWRTDPLNPDTDGDGYSDGAEIKAGYNPLGPGKLTPAIPKP